MIYFHLSVIVGTLIICYKFGDWREWEKYYSTILFFILGEFIYEILFHNNLLWMYVTLGLNHTLTAMVVAFTVFPATVMVFIPHYPEGGKVKQVIYILFWVFIYIFVEYMACRLGSFKYINGWNILWSTAFDLVMFPLLNLHHRKPLLAWTITFAELIVYIIIFKVDILGLI